MSASLSGSTPSSFTKAIAVFKVTLCPTLIYNSLQIDGFDKLLHVSVHNNCRAEGSIAIAVTVGNVNSANTTYVVKVILGRYYLLCNIFLEPDRIGVCQSTEISSTRRAFSLAALVACFMKSSGAITTIFSNLPANDFSDSANVG